MNLRSWAALALRESRGSFGRLAFFAACLSVGVAAVVAVAGLSSALDSGIQSQARQLLAADLVVESRRPIPDEVIAAVDEIDGTRRATVAELVSVVAVPGTADTPGESMLVELKAVSGGYPFYGDLELDPPRPLAALLSEGGVVVGPELLERLRLSPGDPLRIGESTFTVVGVVLAEPDRLDVSLALGPRVFITGEGLERSKLVGVGSRVEHRLLVALSAGATPDDVRRAAARIRSAVSEPGFVGVDTYVEAQPSLRRGLERVERFLGLVALLSLLIGGIGVAQAVRAWIAGRLDSIAVLRALGVRPREVFALYLGQSVALALCGSLAGALAGALVARAAPAFVSSLLPLELRVGWQPWAMARGIGLGLGVAVLFGLRPLSDVLRVPPARVLRRDADPLPVRRWLAVTLLGVLAAGVAATATLQSGSWQRGLGFSARLIGATAVLAAGAWSIVRVVGGVRHGVGVVTLRHGLAALARPGAGTLGAVVALGLGVLVVLGMYLVQQRLSEQLDADLPVDAPTAFLIDIQPDQWDGVRTALEEAGAVDPESVEVVIARLRAIDGVPVSDLVPERGEDDDTGRRSWVLTREQRLALMERLPEDNRIVAGSLWSDPDHAEVSIELDFANDLGVTVGSTLSFDVQGVPVELRVGSLRTVEWERFGLNFFLVVEPGALDRAPRFRVATVRLPPEAERPLQNRLAASFPNVTVLRLREILEKITDVLGRVGLGVRFLGGFTVLAGMAILAGSVSAGALRRAREVALYKTLGMTRAQVTLAFGVEYALVGLVAGAIGTGGAVLLAWSVTRFGFELPWAWDPAAYLLAIVVAAVLTVVAGLSASLRALGARPLTVLRSED